MNSGKWFGGAKDPVTVSRRTYWRLVPRQDITAYEVALILSRMGAGGFCVYPSSTFPEEMRRHFEERPIP